MRSYLNVKCGYQPLSTLRTGNRKATLTVSQLVNYFLDWNTDVIDKRGIQNKHLSWTGLHLNDSGSMFWEDKGYPSTMNNSELGHPLKNDQYNNPCSKNDHDKNIKIDQSFEVILIDVRQQNINRPIIG